MKLSASLSLGPKIQGGSHLSCFTYLSHPPICRHNRKIIIGGYISSSHYRVTCMVGLGKVAFSIRNASHVRQFGLASVVALTLFFIGILIAK